jgi:hypothetical protein
MHTLLRTFALALAGCSFAFVKPPAERPCTGSVVLPIVDAALTLGAEASGVALVAPTESSSNPGRRQFYGVALIAASTALAVSAISGFIATSECRSHSS